jgi:plastocyanin
MPRLLLIAALLAAAPAQQAPGQSPGRIQGAVIVRDALTPVDRPSVARLGAPPRQPVDRSHAVVYLESAPRQAFEPLPPRRVRMDQRGERFEPRVLAITAGTIVDFPNSDATYHNVFSLSQARSFDLGRYAPGRSGAVRFDQPGIVPIFCDIHTHMSAYVLVFSHPFFALTDDGGRYAIPDVPPGAYTLSVWSEVSAVVSRPIVIGPGATVVQNFEIGRQGGDR